MESGILQNSLDAASAELPPGVPPAATSAENSSPGGSLLDRLLELGPAPAPGASNRATALDVLKPLLSEKTPRQLLQALFGPEYNTLAAADAARRLDCLIARINSILDSQVNVVLHHPKFQRLEASWRGAQYICTRAGVENDRAEELGMDAKVVIRIFSASKKELQQDATNATDFDQTVLFKAIYESEFGTAGGIPFGLVVGDYEFQNHPSDLDLLKSFGQVAAAAFAPLVTAASPHLFGLDDFQRLEVGLSLESDFQRADYAAWRSLREREDMRFVGLTLPRVLMRLPYQLADCRSAGFQFRESVEGRDRRKYLWGNAAYAFAATVLRAYVESGWFADIRGFERGNEGGGLVAGLPVQSFATDRAGIATKTSTDIVIGGAQEREFSGYGFIPLCPCPGTEYSVFYSNQSLHKPKVFSDVATSTTSRMSAMLQYILCASRFAHYLKVLARQKIGSVQSAEELETILRDWIRNYVTDDPTAKPEMKARYPLRQAEIEVEQAAGQPGVYRMRMQLLPHYQLDDLCASLHLVHRMATSRA